MGRDVVLIHGMWSTGEHWSAMRAALEQRGYRCHTPTLPYHEPGDTPHPKIGSAGIRDYRNALVEYVDGLQLGKRPVYIGHSMGGLLAQLLAVERPAEALVLFAPAPPAGVLAIHPHSVWSFLPALRRWGFWRRPQKPDRERANWAAWNGMNPDRAAQLYPTLVWESGRALAEIAFWYLARGSATRVDYSKLDCPALFISAGNDRLVPPSVVIAGANAYPYAEYREVENMHHWLIDEFITPDLADQVDRWLTDQLAEGPAE